MFSESISLSLMLAVNSYKMSIQQQLSSFFFSFVPITDLVVTAVSTTASIMFITVSVLSKLRRSAAVNINPVPRNYVEEGGEVALGSVWGLVEMLVELQGLVKRN